MTMSLPQGQLGILFLITLQEAINTPRETAPIPRGASPPSGWAPSPLGCLLPPSGMIKNRIPRSPWGNATLLHVSLAYRWEPPMKYLTMPIPTDVTQRDVLLIRQRICNTSLCAEGWMSILQRDDCLYLIGIDIHPSRGSSIDNRPSGVNGNGQVGAEVEVTKCHEQESNIWPLHY